MRRYAWMMMLALITLGCRPKQKMEVPPSGPAHVGGVITVDGSDDFSGIQLDVVARGDTLFKAMTDMAGAFAATARVPEPAIYTVQVSRNGVRLHVSDIILAPGDSIRIEGSIPTLPRTFSIISRENEAWSTYVRVKLQYDRLIRTPFNSKSRRIPSCPWPNSGATSSIRSKTAIPAPMPHGRPGIWPPACSTVWMTPA